MKNTLRPLALACVLFCGCATAFAQANNLTAQAILQRAIDSAGGDRLLDSVNTMDMIQQVTTSGNDTMYFAVKQQGNNKYLLDILGINVLDDNPLTIFNDGRAVSIDHSLATSIADPGRLELLRADAYLSMDYAYKKMGFNLSRGDDQHYQGTDCYTLFAVSPLGQKTINYYDKKSGHLLMIIYENLYKTVYLEYYRQRGVSVPSRLLMLDPKDNITEVILSRIDDDPVIDTGWFHIPAEGLCKAPALFKTGNFTGLRENKTFDVVREKGEQRETSNKGVQIHYTIDWSGSNDYSLTHDAEYHKCRIINWVGDKCYCHCIASGQPEATVVLQKIP